MRELPSPADAPTKVVGSVVGSPFNAYQQHIIIIPHKAVVLKLLPHTSLSHFTKRIWVFSKLLLLKLTHAKHYEEVIIAQMFVLAFVLF